MISMDEINDLLGFEDDSDSLCSFERIWRLAIFGVSCQRPPQVNIPEGIVLTTAFDLREAVGDRKLPEKSLSFLRIEPLKNNIKDEEIVHMEIMSSSFDKNEPDALRKNRCSIVLTNENITKIVSTDPQSRNLMRLFTFIETPGGLKKSKFSNELGFHWEGHYNDMGPLQILNMKSLLAKCAMLVL